MKNYRHIFFDLDHTLWDFETNCAQTLEELYELYQFSNLGFTANDLVEKYNVVNYRMWYDYNRGKINKEEIRKTRFQQTFEELSVNPGLVPDSINDKFLQICPAKGNVMPYTHEVLDYLSNKYTLHIITNGFKETQSIKINTSHLSKYFQEIVNAEICGFAKPNKQIFDFALNKANAHDHESLMIGDDLYTDIGGARNAGLDQVYYNPKVASHNEEVTYEIKCLSELYNLL
jgi:putative hydrolase of the HAD superfamily